MTWNTDSIVTYVGVLKSYGVISNPERRASHPAS